MEELDFVDPIGFEKADKDLRYGYVCQLEAQENNT